MLIADPARAQEYYKLRDRIKAADEAQAANLLARVSTTIRRTVVEMIDQAHMGHIGGDFSVTDILVSCYWGVLSVDPEKPESPDRDRLILSKGHCAASLYATLASCGFFPRSELASFMAPLSPLNGHPPSVKVPGVETSTGPLGHGFPVATGCALAAKLDGAGWRTVVVLGDGELQEGSNWEAAMTAAHYRLSSLTAVVDFNTLQQGARVADTKSLEPLASKWRSFGWEVREVDGHDHQALIEVLRPSETGAPVAVLAHTVKGKGVSFMEDRVEWHHKVPDRAQVEAALGELSLLTEQAEFEGLAR